MPEGIKNGLSFKKSSNNTGEMGVKDIQNWWTSPSKVASHFGTSGAAVAAATGITHPLDVLKVRLQMQFVGERGPLSGMGQTFVRVVRKEGPRSLYLGLTPALTRSVLYGGLRLGLYEPSKHFCELAFESTNIFMKIASGAASGAFATLLTNPVEVRLQMNHNVHGGAIGELRKIAAKEGIAALWKGVLRKWTSLEEGFYLHLSSSTVAGSVSTLITAPMDMVKTRLMLQQESVRDGAYKNGFHCAYKVTCYGFAIFARLGPQTTITFILCEKMRELAGLKAI
ncbi:Mitochondrial carrier domain-containing protein [Cynara cardunculus var. scolymus]|uniref:Mitochondrial carrier domain-containing protein n=1 Tax=Cynara cardunculus var. scolymus TaxID=59895 RepID=A0A118JWE7_CYNCS|nr:Mitochondrial carrier domain-containing protein [Cynara cardunculus var. scolymus]